MILDDPPTLEIANGGLGLHALRGLFETYSIAMAMVGVCHLAAVKDYYTRFLSFMTHRLDSEAGLRNPSILEAQAADKHMMGVVCELVSERGWTWEDSFHEITHIRSDMTSYLQARPKIVRVQPGKGDAPIRLRPGPYGAKGKDTKGGKGKSKGDKSQRVQWVSEVMEGSQRFPICMRFQTGKCSLGDQCKFRHVCAFPTKDGRACGRNHGAFQHEATPH